MKQNEKAIAEWAVNTCLLMGSSVSTAYAVAGTFVDGINCRSITDEESDSVRALIRSKAIDGDPRF